MIREVKKPQKSQPFGGRNGARHQATAPVIEEEETRSPEETVSRFKPDDDQIAIELMPRLRNRAAFFHNEWKIQEDGVWTSRNASEMRRFIRKELRGWRQFGVAVTQNRIKSIAAMLEDDLFIPDRAIMDLHEERKKYIPLRNGLFNLETMTLDPHRPELYFTNRLDFEYDEDASAPTFRRYLYSSLVLPGTTEPDYDLVRLVKEALGYSLTARTDLKASFWLVGAKDSGKSTMIALLKSIFGALHSTIDLNQLGTNRFLLAGIAGKRVITFTEATGNTVLPDALYKALVGGSDEIYADVKNRDPITFRPEAKVWWGMNEMPRIVDRSGATTRRIIIIPFNRSIPENERIANLEQLLARERPGIFNEMIDFYQGLVTRGDFSYCKQSYDRRAQYIMENDTEATYIEERAELHESYTIQSSELYHDYRIWCEERGFKPKNFNQIAQDWRRLGFTDSKSHGVTVWRGLRLRKTL